MANNIPSSIICFKNGYSYVNVPVPLPFDQRIDNAASIKESTIGPLPDFVVHGTIAVEPQDPGTVKIFSLSKASKANIKPCSELKISEIDSTQRISYETILKENIGARVRVKYQDGELTGTVKSVHKNFGSKGDSLVVLKTQTRNGIRDTLLESSGISFLQTANKMDYDDDSSSSEDEDGDKKEIGKFQTLSVRYACTNADSKEHVSVNLSYLTRGLTWAPSYMLRQDKTNKTITLEGNACILCDLPFFMGSSIDSVALVAGHPKIEFENVNDPLVSGVTAATFIEQIGAGKYISNKGYSKKPQWRTQAYACYMHDYDYSEDIYASAEGLASGENMDNLYFYKLKNVPLHYNRPINLPFIEKSQPKPYEDVYFFDLDSDKQKHEKDDTILEATHAITFRNTYGQPLTNGPVSILLPGEGEGDMSAQNGQKRVNGNNFLLQSRINFTGINKLVTVEMTKAIDVDGKILIETSKEKKVEVKKTTKRDKFFFVDKKATFTISNMKNEDIKCKVDHLLYGHLEKSMPVPLEKTERHTRYHDLNPQVKYVWELMAPARGKVELVFSYCIKKWAKVNEAPATDTVDSVKK